MMATGVAVRGHCWVMRLQEGWTAVMLAAENGHESTAGLLLDRGADMEARNKVSGGVVDPCPRRRSGVAASATGGVCSCCCRWTGAGSGRPAALVGRCGLRAVCEAACPPRVWGGGRGGGHGGGTGCRGVWWCGGRDGDWRGRCWVVRLQDGWTAVMLAAQNGHESTARLLLDRGADVEARTLVRLCCALQRLASSLNSFVALPCSAFCLLLELNVCYASAATMAVRAPCVDVRSFGGLGTP